MIGLSIFLAPVSALVAVVANSKAREDARIGLLSPERQVKERTLRNAKRVVSAILVAAISLGGGQRSLVVVVCGTIVLIGWLAWVRRHPEPKS